MVKTSAPCTLAEAVAGAGGGARDAAGAIRALPIEALEPSPFQPRGPMDAAPLQELADSIREHGVLQPILVRPKPGGGGQYEIVGGERRWRAAQRAGGPIFKRFRALALV